MIPLTFFILLPSSFILLTFSARMNSFLFCLYFQASSQVESSQNSVEENFLIPILLRQGFVGHGPESRNSLCPKSSSDPTNKWRTSNLGPICSGIRRCRLFQHCSTTMLELNKVPCGLRKTASSFAQGFKGPTGAPFRRAAHIGLAVKQFFVLSLFSGK